MIYFKDFLDTNFQQEDTALSTDSSESSDLIDFPKELSFSSKEKIGKYVDLLMQLPDDDSYADSSENQTIEPDGNFHHKLAEVLVEKGIL